MEANASKVVGMKGVRKFGESGPQKGTHTGSVMYSVIKGKGSHIGLRVFACGGSI